MLHTEYSWMTTEEIIEFTEFRVGGSTPLEHELALRLRAALAALASDTPVHIIPEAAYGADTGRPG